MYGGSNLKSKLSLFIGIDCLFFLFAYHSEDSENANIVCWKEMVLFMLNKLQGITEANMAHYMGPHVDILSTSSFTQGHLFP